MTDDPKTSRADLRRHRRIPVKVYADLYWEGADRRMNFERAYLLDVSEGGLRLRLSSGGLKVGASVHVRIEQFGFAEYGIVRYALGHGIVGVELRFETVTEQQIERWKKIVGSAQNT
jgi:hypothetical protein